MNNKKDPQKKDHLGMFSKKNTGGFKHIKHADLAPGLEVFKLFSCSTQLSTKFQLLIKTKIMTNEEVSCFNAVFIMLINIKMPTNVGILTFMSRINFVLS